MDAPQSQPQAKPKKPFAWQPLTFRGVSRFAAAPLGRVWLVQFLFSLVVAAAVIWFLYVDWLPVVAKAARKLPAASEIRGGKLDWQGEPAVLLAENRFLALAVDVKHAGQARSPAQVSLELGPRDYKVFSLLGYVQWSYPRGWMISLARDEVISWWGAWSPVILGLLGAGAIGVMLLLWSVLSSVYFLPVWLLAYFNNRQLSMSASWRLASAAQMTGALWLAGAILAYGLTWFGLVGLTLAFGVDLVIGWIYLVGSILKLPLSSETAAVGGNPFAAKSTTPDESVKKSESENPFGMQSGKTAEEGTTKSEAGVTIESIDKPPDDAEGAESGQKPPESPV
jgi:hypothetical protein